MQNGFSGMLLIFSIIGIIPLFLHLIDAHKQNNLKRGIIHIFGFIVVFILFTFMIRWFKIWFAVSIPILFVLFFVLKKIMAKPYLQKTEKKRNSSQSILDD